MICGTWDLSWSGIEPTSPASAGRFFTTEPPGQSPFPGGEGADTAVFVGKSQDLKGWCRLSGAAPWAWGGWLGAASVLSSAHLVSF